MHGEDQSSGALLDPTGSLSARLLSEPPLRRACGLDRPTVPVLLTQARLDQFAALIELRHGPAVDLYTTPALFERLSATDSIWPALQSRCTMHWRMVPVGGDLHEASFKVEGQSGVSYVALACGADDGQEAPPLALLVRDQATGASLAWVHAGAQEWPAVIQALAPHWAEVRWLVASADEEHPMATVEWLQRAPVPHKLLMGAVPDDVLGRVPPGVQCARDGMDIVVR